MDNTSASKEQEVVPAIISSNTQDVSETTKQFNPLPEIDHTEVALLDEESQGNDRSNSAHLDNTEMKDRQNPDTSALTDETVNPCGLELRNSDEDKDEAVTFNMDCVSNKEKASKSDTKLKHNDIIDKNQDEEILFGDTANNKLFVYPAEVCRPKIRNGSPTVSSFPAGNQSGSKISTAIDKRTGNADQMTGLGDQNPQASLPERAVRPKNQKHDESRKSDGPEMVGFGRETNSKDPGRGRGKGKKGQNQHNIDKDGGEDGKKGRKFKGIDKKWKTNYDDAYDEAHEKYEYFWRKHCVYSQWHYSVFYDADIKFTCAEQYMMYQKAVLFGDSAIANKILLDNDPRRIKSLGRKVHGFTDEVWNANCLHIVKQGNIAKFSKNKKLKKSLFSTYPKILVEASPMDRIWGIGLAEDDERAWDESTWEGKNYLGYVVTEVRDELMEEAGIIGNEDKKVYIPTLLNNMEKAQKEKGKHNKQVTEVTEVNKEVTKFNKEDTDVNKEVTDVSKDATEVNKTTTDVNKEVTEVNKEVTEVNKTATDVNKDATEVNKDATEVNKTATDVNKEVTEVNKDATEVNKTATDVNKDPKEVNKEIVELNKDVT